MTLKVAKVHPEKNRNNKVGVHKVPKEWILAASREKVFIFERDGRDLVLLCEMSHKPDVISEETNKARGRHVNPAGGGARHGMEPREAQMRHEDALFMGEVSGFLSTAFKQEKFERLVLAAAPKTLGEMRKVFPPDIAGCIYAELNKDLIHLDARALAEYMQEHVWS